MKEHYTLRLNVMTGTPEYRRNAVGGPARTVSTAMPSYPCSSVHRAAVRPASAAACCQNGCRPTITTASR